ncbi:hypothetical protein PR202_gb13140 [Eleusine coracana subsp. coracana]|uniref:DUF4220 domain-containing protein n=1 Tax=Eleusine coracana subsp. coracana TaxID=191504 RepID=A0AAV5ERP3_ELECO|nr:hypothetical protein QOZ80_9BG0710980 [Eleusine coracana subsp. coracana]GJN25325.1 hypothetical protein PR202_gb13140 [Eleusine coracana subsp. coracana]
MSFSEAVQWWDEWQLRILVLGSLFLQYFLFITAALRKRRTPAWFRFLTWLAYLFSDALAIYALATLFNRHKKQEWLWTHRDSAGLEALWAPILLLHLGGQDGITAYSIEDNEMWKRHVLTAMSQIAVAVYVFRKSLSGGDNKLFKATILVFIPGILKCLEKPWALKKASFNSMAEALGSRVHDATGVNSLDEYVQAAVAAVRGGGGDGEEKPSDSEVNDKPYRLFVDLPYSYFVRLQNLKYMVQISRDGVQFQLCSGLSNTFSRLYTKSEVYKGGRGSLLRAVAVILTFASIVLFHKSHRESYNVTDVKITYALLWCTAAMEFMSVGLKSCFNYFVSLLRLPEPDQVEQYNLIGHLANKKKRKRLAFWLGSLDQFCCMPPAPSESSDGITKLVFDHIILHGWRNCISDTATYRRFNDSRGQCTLEREGCSNLETRLQMPFDESVLVWHLATDFCLYHREGWTDAHEEAASRCREISNYMAYLLFINPEMLMPGARPGLIRAACYEIKYLLMGDQPQSGVPDKKLMSLAGDEELARKIIRTLENTVGTRFAHCALALAKDLLSLGKHKMWRVIQGVWVEMLCFSAGRSRGYLHAKSLGRGGEYISYIWLLLWYMGMETLADRLQRTELHEKGDMGASVQTLAPVLASSELPIFAQPIMASGPQYYPFPPPYPPGNPPPFHPDFSPQNGIAIPGDATATVIPPTAMVIPGNPVPGDPVPTATGDKNA